MKITRRQLKMIIESFLIEKTTTAKMKCPKCGTINEVGVDKCTNCGHDYDAKFQGKPWEPAKSLRERLIKRADRNESIQEERKRGRSKETQCPTATLDISVNTANRDRARKLDWIMYGPLNVEFPGKYWKKIAAKWGTSSKAAKKSNCGNCVAFDLSPKMVDECIPAITSEPVADEFGVLGYCWMHHFKCHSARTCNTWASGGPIKTDEVSGEWFDRNKEGALKKDPIDTDIYKDDTEGGK